MKGRKMHTFNFLKLLPHFLFTLNFFLITSQSQQTPTRFCGKTLVEAPFFVQKNSSASSPLRHMMLCKSQKLYFRTTIGLFPISSIDYETKTLTISHPSSCSPIRRYISPVLLMSGFSTPSVQPNSLMLLNCANKTYPTISSYTHGCTNNMTSCRVDSKTKNQLGLEHTHPCLIFNDIEKLGKGFHPKELQCSHYNWVHKRSLKDVDYRLGTLVSFDIPDHVPDVCGECKKANGNCGIGLRCICHLQECKDKIISFGGSVRPNGNILLCIFFLIVVNL